ncbi:hypothetical protein EMCRGX_G028902 [Ephydatia muelleri]
MVCSAVAQPRANGSSESSENSLDNQTACEETPVTVPSRNVRRQRLKRPASGRTVARLSKRIPAVSAARPATQTNREQSWPDTVSQSP